eukprot:1087620-Prymnesium_polylepis.1
MRERIKHPDVLASWGLPYDAHITKFEPNGGAGSIRTTALHTRIATARAHPSNAGRGFQDARSRSRRLESLLCSIDDSGTLPSWLEGTLIAWGAQENVTRKQENSAHIMHMKAQNVDYNAHNVLHYGCAARQFGRE